MTTVTIRLPSETEQKLRAKASRSGMSLESYIQDVVRREALNPPEGAAPDPAPPSAADLEADLDELAAGLPPLPSLPVDFSRADVYGERG